MSAIWALARQTFVESVRRKVFAVLVLFCLALLGAAFLLPVIDEGQDRLKLVQSFAFGGTTLFGMLIAVFIAASILPEDVAERRIFSVLVAPVPRSHYLLGRFLGVALVLGLLVASVWLITVGVLPLFLRGLGPGESERLLVARSPAPAGKLVWSDGRGLGDPAPNPGRAVSFLFEGLRPARLPAGPLAGTLLLDAQPRNPEEFIRIYKIALRYRNPATGQAGPWIVRFGRIGKPLSVEGPRELVDAGGRFEVQLLGADPRLRYRAGPESLRLYAVRSHYGLNFARGFLVVYCQLLLVAAVALAGSTFLTAPVAILATLFVTLVGNLLDVLRSFALALGHRPTLLEEIVSGPGGHEHHAHEQAEHLAPHLAAIKQVLLWFCDAFPDFSRFDMTPRLIERIAIPDGVVAGTALYAAFYGVLIGLFGLVVFQFREVDRT